MNAQSFMNFLNQDCDVEIVSNDARILDNEEDFRAIHYINEGGQDMTAVIVGERHQVFVGKIGPDALGKAVQELSS